MINFPTFVQVPVGLASFLSNYTSVWFVHLWVLSNFTTKTSQNRLIFWARQNNKIFSITLLNGVKFLSIPVNEKWNLKPWFLLLLTLSLWCILTIFHLKVSTFYGKFHLLQENPIVLVGGKKMRTPSITK